MAYTISTRSLHTSEPKELRSLSRLSSEGRFSNYENQRIYEKSECQGTRFFVVSISPMTVGTAQLTRRRLRWLVVGSLEPVRWLACDSLV